MVYVRITEGLGNQFYKYAFAYSLSRDNGQRLIIDLAGYRYDTRSFELDKYQITAKQVCLAVPKKNNLLEKLIARIKRRSQIGIFYKMISEDPEIYYQYKPVRCSVKRNIYVQGYWQNYKYFSKYEQDIRAQFILRNMSERVKAVCDMLASRETVAVHVRLGDIDHKIG